MNHLRSRKFSFGLVLLFGFSLWQAIPASAQSRSATVMVSVTILPSIELSSAKGSEHPINPSITRRPAVSNPRSLLAITGQKDLIKVSTNLGNQYRIVETLLKIGNNHTKLYSVTAL